MAKMVGNGKVFVMYQDIWRELSNKVTLQT